MISEGHEAALVLFARAPRLGRVKTRLQPEISAAESLELHRALVRDTVGLVREFSRRGSASATVALSEPLAAGEAIAAELEGLEVTIQTGDGLGERLVHAYQDRMHRGARRVVVIGSDSPTLDPEYLDAAFDALRTHEVVIGPAEDGGYVLIGCSRLHLRPFQRISWGTKRVLAETVRVLRRQKIPHHLLRPQHDLDTRDDLIRTYRELEHLEQVGALRASRTLEVLRDLLHRRPEWLLPG